MSDATRAHTKAPPVFEGLETVRALGRGMVGEVFETRDLRSGQRFVVKRFRPHAARHLDLARFMREAQVMARLQHPNLMPVLRVHAAATPPYFVMPYREGTILADAVVNGRMPVPVSARVARDAATGLIEAHRLGIIHRDVKPGNVLLEATGRSVVLDFGLAKDLAGDEKLTASGALLGTPAYMAPEQCRGEKVDRRVDVYALGVTIFELVIGKNPFLGLDVVETLRRHLQESPRRLDALLPGRVCPELDELVHRMIAKDPAHRPSMESCLETLNGLCRRYDNDARRSTRCSQRPLVAPVRS